jgi:hypothetical protein
VPLLSVCFTSTPIFNKLLGQKGATIDIYTYNKWSLPFAIICNAVKWICPVFKIQQN